jgi:hypothetical protein
VAEPAIGIGAVAVAAAPVVAQAAVRGVTAVATPAVEAAAAADARNDQFH